MRNTAVCPKCSGKKIVVAELRHVVEMDVTNVSAIPVVAVETRSQVLNIPKGHRFGHFESWTCAACGFTELYAKDLGNVDALAAKHPAAVRIVNGDIPANGPFR